MLILHKGESGSHMVALHRTCVIVKGGQRVAGLDQKVVVDATVLIVVDDG